MDYLSLIVKMLWAVPSPPPHFISRDGGFMKICKLCGLAKEKFQKNRHGNPGSVCTTCRSKQHSAYYRKHPVIYLLNACRQRCRQQRLPYNLTKEDIIIPEYCPVLGVKLEHGTKPFCDNSPSIDRIYPEKGYIKGNVVVISWRANRLKSDASLKELEYVVNRLRSVTKNT